MVDEGSEVGESDPQADQDGLPPLLDDIEIDDALSPMMQTVLESKPAKGEPAPQEKVDAMVTERKKAEHEAFALAMTLPVTSGAFRLIKLDYAASDEGYVQHICGLRTSLENDITTLNLLKVLNPMSEEDLAQLEAEFVGDAFVELTEEEIMNLESTDAKEEYAAQKG